MRSSPKRRRGDDGGALLNVVPKLAVGRPQGISVKGEESTNDHRENLFLTLSTSPINSDVEATPVSKNTMKPKNGTGMGTTGGRPGDQIILPSRSLDSFDRASDTPTPPLPKGTADRDINTDEHLLNRHLRGQSFTPLPHTGQYSESREGNSSPPGLTMAASFATLGGQLSWDITGDAPSLGDLAHCQQSLSHRCHPFQSIHSTICEMHRQLHDIRKLYARFDEAQVHRSHWTLRRGRRRRRRLLVSCHHCV